VILKEDSISQIIRMRWEVRRLKGQTITAPKYGINQAGKPALITLDPISTEL
jgi:hypothetical protein